MANIFLTPAGRATLASTLYDGSDASGSDKATSRTLDVGGTPLLILVDRRILIPTTDFTVSGNVVTFNISLENRHKLSVWT